MHREFVANAFGLEIFAEVSPTNCTIAEYVRTSEFAWVRGAPGVSSTRHATKNMGGILPVNVILALDWLLFPSTSSSFFACFFFVYFFHFTPQLFAWSPIIKFRADNMLETKQLKWKFLALYCWAAVNRIEDWALIHICTTEKWANSKPKCSYRILFFFLHLSEL